MKTTLEVGEIEEMEDVVTFGEIEEIEDAVEKKFKRFKNFDILGSPPYDHHFVTYKSYVRQIDPKSNRAKLILKEWQVLKERLPSSILVRVYEGRLDLMRAVIQGLQATPYHHGLFFFDICFPSNYPARPPKIFYHSYGFDLNPNLRKDGTVSLDLLNLSHWCQCQLHEEQKWDNPRQSNVLQVLILIQHLVLNSKPYFYESLRTYMFNDEQAKKYNKDIFDEFLGMYIFNEELAKKYKEDILVDIFDVSLRTYVFNEEVAKKYKVVFDEALRMYMFNGEVATKYNKDIFMQTCVAMLYTLKKPPRDFEDFVAGYFRNRAHPILLNYKAQMNSDKVMNQLFCKLLGAFEANGTYCGHHLHAMLKEEESPEENNLNNGPAMNMVLKVMNKLKNIVDLLS